MEPKMIAEQILHFQKSLLLNARMTTDALQEYGEKMAKVLVEPLPNIPDEAKQLLDAWMKNLKECQKELEALQDESLETLKGYIMREP